MNKLASEEAISNAKQERTNSAGKAEIGEERNVSGDESSAHRTATGEDSTGNVQPASPNDQHGAAASTSTCIYSAQPQHNASAVYLVSGSSGAQDEMDEIMVDAKQAEEALKGLATGSPKADVTSEGNAPPEGGTEKMEENLIKDAAQENVLGEQGIQLQKVSEDNMPASPVNDAAQSPEGVMSKNNTPAFHGESEKEEKDLSKDFGQASPVNDDAQSPKGDLTESNTPADHGESEKGEKDLSKYVGHATPVNDNAQSPKGDITESNTPADHGKSEKEKKDLSKDVGQASPVNDNSQSPKGDITDSNTSADHGKSEKEKKDLSKDVGQASPVNDNSQTPKSDITESNTPADQGKSEKMEENQMKGFDQGGSVNNSTGVPNNQLSFSTAKTQNADSDLPLREEHSSPGSPKPPGVPGKEPLNENADGDIRDNQNNSVGRDQSKEKPDQEKNETSVEPDQLKRTSGHGDVVGSGNERKTEKKEGFEETTFVSIEIHNDREKIKKERGQKKHGGGQEKPPKDKFQNNNKNSEKKKSSSVEGGKSPTYSELIAAKGEERDNVPSRVNILDLFEKDSRKRMTVVFHAILSPQFKFNRKDGDQVFVRFGGGAFKNFNVNILEMKPVRYLSDDFVLLEGKLSAPPDVLRDKRPYKYIVLKPQKKPDPYIWEYLHGPGPHINRCLKVPKGVCTKGGQVLTPKTSVWETILIFKKLMYFFP